MDTPTATQEDPDSDHARKKPQKPRENGGKFGFDDYPEAPTTVYEIEGISAGDLCQCCGLGKYYPSEDRKLLEFTGSPILTVKKHIKKVLRCNRCGHEQFNKRKVVKWKNEARSSLVVYKALGMPWYRISRLQKLFGVPIAMSTQWLQCKSLWEECAQYVVSELYHVGIEHHLWYTDDTGARILSVLEMNKGLPEKEQRGCHTTAICTGYGEHKIILYITANRYCRENWVPLLERRTTTDKLTLMTDASSQSIPKGKELERVESAICLGGHGRKKFKEEERDFPEECAFFLKLISDIYQNDHACIGESHTERLVYHQKHSAPLIEALYAKIEQLFSDKMVEPNSDFGRALNYWLNHRQGLTAFLRVPGAPLDNNWAENALRLMAVYRKASLFFKTLSSAAVLSDLFSLVATCEANGINAFAYLNWIQTHWLQVQKNPQSYLPWCFKADTERIAS